MEDTSLYKEELPGLSTQLEVLPNTKANTPFNGSEILPEIISSSSSSVSSPSREPVAAQAFHSLFEKNSDLDPGRLRKRPLHRTEVGYCTSNGRIDWCKANGISDAEHAQHITKALTANDDPNSTLYYWQLFSLLGIELIRNLVTDFYTNVYADKEENWFRDAFVQISDVQHHISTQTAYW
jgi:hypothetical protein